MQLGFDYLLAVEARDGVQAARLAPQVQQLPDLLPTIAQLIIFPVTALSDDTDPCADSFVLDELGVIYFMTINEWASEAPASAAAGIARTLAHFVGQGPRRRAEGRPAYAGSDTRRTPEAGPRGTPRNGHAPVAGTTVRHGAHPGQPLRSTGCAPTLPGQRIESVRRSGGAPSVSGRGRVRPRTSGASTSGGRSTAMPPAAGDLSTAELFSPGPPHAPASASYSATVTLCR
ncbi:hypothetical protein AB0B79_38515 [Streptomyces sp. NPDC039022]|uniref:hypothetical protein n=1 Tax=unclassified Streptomyces TaxID=2593676 RepID=UPI0033EDA4F2